MKIVNEVALEEAKLPRRIDKVVASVLGIVAFLYLTTLFNVIVPHYGYSTSGATHLLVLSTTTLLGLSTYLACVFVNPGTVPRDWYPDVEPASTPAVVQVKRSGEQRWCKKCSAAKPPRAHHCRRCGRCVLRMDHHCVWINNCVGHGNYRAFFQMAFYLTTAVAHATALLLALNTSIAQLALGWDPEGALSTGEDTSVRSTVGRRVGWTGPFWGHAVFQLIATAMAFPLTLSLGTLLVWNCHLLSKNKTTIEHHEGVAAKLNAAAAAYGVGAGRSGVHPWDLGDWHMNVAATFGEEVTWWLVPWRASAEGKGTEYVTRWDGGASGGGEGGILWDRSDDGRIGNGNAGGGSGGVY